MVEKPVAVGIALVFAAAIGHGAYRGESAAAIEPVAYRLVETWGANRPLHLWESVDWPQGHQPGGVGLTTLTERWVATDRTARTVRVYGPDRRLPMAVIGGPEQLVDPRDATIFRDNSIAVSDSGAGLVVMFAPDGTVIGTWPVANPRGIAAVTVNVGLPGERAYVLVVDAGTRRALLFDINGTLAGEISLSGVVEPDMLADVEVRSGAGDAPDLAIIVVDMSDGRLWRADRSGASVVLGRAGTTAALAVRPLDATGGAGLPALLLGVSGRGIELLDGERRSLGPTAMLPFDAVIDIARPRRGSGVIVAAVEPDGLVVLGDDPVSLAQELANATSGRFFAPRRIAAGHDVLVADALPRIAIWADGSPLRESPLPGPPRSDDAALARDVAATGDQRYALVADGRLLGEQNGAFNRFRDAPIDEPSLRWAIAALTDEVLLLDLLKDGGVVQRIDQRLSLLGSWSLAGSGGARLPSDLDSAGDLTWLAVPGEGFVETRASDGRPVGRVRLAGVPERIATGPGGHAWVLTTGGWVFRLDLGLNVVAAFAAGPGGSAPVDIDVDERGRVYIADEEGHVRVYAPDDAASAPQPPPVARAGNCTAVTDKVAVPPKVDLGRPITITLSISGHCAAPPEPLDIVLAVDRSASMGAHDKRLAMIEATAAFATHVNPASARVGVVAFGNRATATLAPTADASAAILAVVGLNAVGDTDLVGAISSSVALLNDDRRPEASLHAIVLTDGHHTVSDPPASALDAAIARAASAGVTLHAVALGTDADLDALTRIAGDPARLHRSPSPRELSDLYAGLARNLGAGPLFSTITITDRLPADMMYVPGSARPPAELIDDGQTLRWRLSNIAAPRMDLTYSVRPTMAGLRPTNISAVAEGRDGLGGRVGLTFPIPTVQVLIDGRTPTPPATPTPGATALPTTTAPPSATATPSPTPTASPAAPSPTVDTPPPTSTPTTDALRQSAYLPIVLLVRCPGGRKPVDIVLVLDTSQSMESPTSPGGPSRKEAAVEAATTFLTLLNFPQDRAAIIGFNDRASRATGLTNNIDTLQTALNSLTTAPGSRIDQGLDAARRVLRNEPADRLPAIVLLTDGVTSNEFATAALLIAEDLRRNNITTFTIGLGDTANPTLLRLLATTPGQALWAPSTTDLESAFRAVAARIPCS